MILLDRNGCALSRHGVEPGRGPRYTFNGSKLTGTLKARFSDRTVSADVLAAWIPGACSSWR